MSDELSKLDTILLESTGAEPFEALLLERMSNILDIDPVNEFHGLRGEARLGETVG